MGFLAVGVIVALGLVIFNLVMTFALVRKLREDGPNSPSPVFMATQVGSPVGPFHVPTRDHVLTELDLADGSWLVCFISATCESCHELIEAIEAGRYDQPDRVAVFVLGDDGQIANIVERLPAAYVGGLSRQDSVSTAFGSVDAYPSVFRVERGVIVAAGPGLDRIVTQADLTTARSANVGHHG